MQETVHKTIGMSVLDIDNDVNTHSLTEKQEKFAQLFVVNNGKRLRQCAVHAGYCDNKGTQGLASRLAKNPAIVQRIAQIRRDALAKNSANFGVPTAEEVLQGFSAIATDEKESTQNRLKALEALAKYHGLLKDKVQVEQTDYSSIVEQSRARLKLAK